MFSVSINNSSKILTLLKYDIITLNQIELNDYVLGMHVDRDTITPDDIELYNMLFQFAIENNREIGKPVISILNSKHLTYLLEQFAALDDISDNIWNLIHTNLEPPNYDIEQLISPNKLLDIHNKLYIKYQLRKYPKWFKWFKFPNNFTPCDEWNSIGDIYEYNDYYLVDIQNPYLRKKFNIQYIQSLHIRGVLNNVTHHNDMRMIAFKSIEIIDDVLACLNKLCHERQYAEYTAKYHNGVIINQSDIMVRYDDIDILSHHYGIETYNIPIVSSVSLLKQKIAVLPNIKYNTLSTESRMYYVNMGCHVSFSCAINDGVMCYRVSHPNTIYLEMVRKLHDNNKL